MAFVFPHLMAYGMKTSASPAHKEINDRLEGLQQKHQLSTSLRAQRAALKQTEIDQGLAALVKTLHLMIPSVRATSIRPEEERLRGALEAVEDELKRPGGLGRMKGKLSELWTAVNALKAMKERARASSGGASEGGGGGQQVEWQVVDEGGLNELAGVSPAFFPFHPASKIDGY